MIAEFSAGGVVYRIYDGQPHILLCLQKKLAGNAVYCLPKGHIEDGEALEDTALREVLEEAGVTAEIKNSLGHIDYCFIQRGKRTKKTVHFFLMRCVAENFQPSIETEKIIWCTRKDALSLDPYSSERNIIMKAFDELKKMSL